MNSKNLKDLGILISNQFGDCETNKEFQEKYDKMLNILMKKARIRKEQIERNERK